MEATGGTEHAPVPKPDIQETPQSTVPAAPPAPPVSLEQPVRTIAAFPADQVTEESPAHTISRPEQESLGDSPVAGKFTRSPFKIWWLWIILGIIVAGCTFTIFFRPSPASGPASASILYDNFTRDQSLSTGLWKTMGKISNANANRRAFPAKLLVKPVLTFSPQSGLGISGSGGNDQAAAIQSVVSFDAPMKVTAQVMPPDGDNDFMLIVADSSGRKGVGIVGRLASGKGAGGIGYSAREAGTGRKQHGILFASPEPNTWYKLSITVDSSGKASLIVSDGNNTLGQANAQVGNGPLYIYLAEGAGTSGSIARAVYWRSVRVQSGAPLASQSGGSSQTVASALPTVRDATIRQSATGLTLPSGASLYLYGMATGGAAPSRGFSSGPYAQVMDAAGAVADALAATSSNSNSYATDTGFHVIGGVAVSGFSHYKATYGSDGTWGTNSASDTFAIPHKSLVVVIGLASSQQSIRLDGIPSLKTDALSSGAGATLGMIIAHAYLGPGEYTVTENSGALAGGQNPNHMADLVGVFVFQ